MHKQQGKYSKALSHLSENDKLWQSSSDEESVATPVTSNKPIYMSNIDSNNCSSQASSLTSNVVKEKESLQELRTISSEDPSPIPNEEPNQVPIIISDSIQSLSTYDHQLNPLDRNEFYYEVINRIEVMDEILDGNNNGDTDVDW